MILHEKLSAQIPTWRERIKTLSKEHGDVVVDTVTVGQIVGGMRDIKSLLTDVSFVDPAEGTDRECRPQIPQFLVDVSSMMDKKRAMLACHESQRQWLKEHHGMDNFIETMEEWTALRGQLAGMAFGEGFRQYKMHPYPTAGLLQELLGADLVKRLDH